MSSVSFKLNNTSVTANPDETILSVARRNGVYIPTMCYLKKTNPSASCRLCVVEVEGVDGMILSCQTKPTSGISVTTDSEQLQQERTNIMKLYGVNHPLECGVCDKSGECDLQNKTVEFGVEQQNFSAKDQYRKIEKWGLINYNPSLCIMCEKCTHVCNEIIGDDAIDIKYGGYGSHIVPKNSDTLECTFCGECIAVCPVGALVSSNFQYRANSWELKKVPSTCPHCSAGCALEYEVKSIANGEEVYRVTNDFEHTTLCGAGRFGFNYHIDSEKDETSFTRAVDAIRESKAIRFSSIISNEEALMLERIRERYGIKLFNEEAREYTNFTDALYRGGATLASLDEIKKSDAVVVIGTRISSDNPAVRYSITEASSHKGAKVVYMHPIEDVLMQSSVTQFVKYEAGSEEGVLAILAMRLLQDCELDEQTKSYLNGLDDGYLSAESNVGEDELDAIAQMLKRRESRTLVLGSDLFGHARAENIARLSSLLYRYANFNIVVVAKEINSVGVSRICNLDVDDRSIKDVVGYNAVGDFKIAHNRDSDLIVGALNAQEGTIVNLEYRLLPLNVAVPFNGYTLNDIANGLGVGKRETIDFTSELPQDRGFKDVEFDSLENYYTFDGVDVRGYLLKQDETKLVCELDEVDDLDEFNGTVIYRCDETLQFNSLSARCSELSADYSLVGSPQFAVAARVVDGDEVIISSETGERVRKFKVDTELKGTIALEPTVDRDSIVLFGGYRYEKVQIRKGGFNE